jgi:hypothetical protein
LQTVGTVDPETNMPIRDSCCGGIAAGANGVLAVTWQDSRFTGGAYDAIAFSQSIDGGFTWSAPIRINGEPAVRALIPSIAIRADGTIGVTYYDFRSNTPDPETLLADHWFATSSDGVTWSERRIAGPFDYAKAAIANGAYFLGDYMGVATMAASFITVFGQTTADPENRSDIFVGLVRDTTETGALTQPVTTGTDPGILPKADVAARIRAAVRKAFVARLPR